MKTEMVCIHVPTPALSGSGNMGLISALYIEAPLNEIAAKLFKIIIPHTLLFLKSSNC